MAVKTGFKIKKSKLNNKSLKYRKSKSKTRTARQTNLKTGINIDQQLGRFFKKHLRSLKQEELKELSLINGFKLTIARAQIDALVQLLKKKKLLTYEEFWKATKQFLEESIIE